MDSPLQCHFPSSLVSRDDRRVGPAERAVAILLVVILTVSAFVGAPAAQADDVDDLNARADRIARQLMDLQIRISAIGEQFDQSQVRRSDLAAQTADIQRRSRAARVEMAARRADAAHYALSAYVGLDQGDVLAMALDGRQWDLSRRTGYVSIRVGDHEEVVDQLRAAQQVDADLTAALDAANDAEARVATDLARQQSEATRLLSEQESLQASVQGSLAQAVARRQAALAAQTTTGTVSSDMPGGPGSLATPGGPSSTAGSPAAGPNGSTVAPGNSAPPATRPSPGPSPTPPSSPPPVVTAPPPLVPPPPATGRGRTAANAAISQLGVRYSWGGGTASGPSMGFGPGAGIVGYDCSGLTLYAWAQAGVYLPHSAQMQYDMSAKVSLSQLQPGDLVFYGSSSRTIDHVSIYVGGGQVVHAPNSRSVVQYGPVQLWPGYYPWIGAGRPG